jgi:hypothetical protein
MSLQPPDCPDYGATSEKKPQNPEILPTAVAEVVASAEDSCPPPKKFAPLAKQAGTAGNPKPIYDSPTRVTTQTEHGISKGNAFITLGVDRVSNPFTGFGGRGHSHASAVDICVGMQAHRAKSYTKDGKEIFANPDAKSDAARIYMSQKSNIDSHFQLPAGRKGNTTEKEPRSAIALKADTLRFISRENIKLVCRTDQQNSLGGECNNADTSRYGIDLIGLATPCEEGIGLQPLVKGDDLAACLIDILDLLTAVVATFENSVDISADVRDENQAHKHHSPFFGKSTAPDFLKLLPQCAKASIEEAITVMGNTQIVYANKIAAIKSKYLMQGIPGRGEKYILSKYNNTN